MNQKVLIIGKVWPEPKSSAAGSRMLQLIQGFLKQSYQVSFATAASKSPFMISLEKLNVNEISIQLNDSSFDRFMKELNPDIVLFDRFTTEEQFGWRVAETCPNALRILDTEDLHSLRASRELAVKNNKVFELHDLSTTIAYREIASIYRCDLSLIISEYEYHLLLNYFKIDPDLLLYLPFMLDPLSESEIVGFSTFEERNDFVSIGNFLHAPNWDAVLFLKTEIWPLIRAQLPKTNILVYGAYPSHKVNELNNIKEGFIIKGRAENIDEVLQHAKVLLAPLRFGAGLKGKFIDAMKNGTPTVTTEIGVEAMCADLEWCGEVKNTPILFAQAAVELYTTKTLWQKAQQNGCYILNTLFSKTEHENRLFNSLVRIKNNLSHQRLKNFTGAMLLQQTTQSSKYMSLWIEAKNKPAKI